MLDFSYDRATSLARQVISAIISPESHPEVIGLTREREQCRSSRGRFAPMKRLAVAIRPLRKGGTGRHTIQDVALRQQKNCESVQGSVQSLSNPGSEIPKLSASFS